MRTPLRVFVEATAAGDRRRLLDEAQRAGWRLVDRPTDADVVLRAAGPSTVADDATVDDHRLVEALTSREREVLVLLADGLGNRDIAHALGISEHTVKFHLAAVFGKLGASTRTEAVRRALGFGLIHL